MSRLALTLPLQEGETPASFAARLAYRNRTKPRDFCSDMGLRWPHVCSGHSDQLRRLAYLSVASFERLELASARFISPSRYQVGLSSATSGTFRRAITRVCPTCVLDAMERHGEAGPFQNLEWLLLCVAVCREHNVQLIQLPNADHAHKTYDVVKRTQAFRETLAAGRDGALTCCPTAFESYVCNRIWSPPPKSWLSGWDLTDLHQGSLTLGMAMRFGSSRLVSSLSDDEAREAMDAGFRILSRGPKALVKVLDRLRENYRTERPYFSKDMGPFYVWLKDNSKNSRLKGIRHCVERFVLEQYPLQIGKFVFSKKMAQPKFMTLNQVRKTHGLGHVRVRSILAQIKGERHHDLQRMKDISHADLEAVLEVWDGLQNIKSAAAKLSVLPQQIKPLTKAGVLCGRKLGSSLLYIERSSVYRMLDRLAHLPISSGSKTLLPLKSYCRTQKIPLADTVALWVDGKLKDVRRDPNEPGLQGLLLPGLVERQAKQVCLSRELTLSETACRLKIGIGSVRRLRDSGHLVLLSKRNPETRHQKSYISRESIRLFESRYLTLGQISAETGHASIHVARWLDQNAFETIECESGFVRVYEREVALAAVQALLPDGRSKREER